MQGNQLENSPGAIKTTPPSQVMVNSVSPQTRNHSNLQSQMKQLSAELETPLHRRQLQNTASKKPPTSPTAKQDAALAQARIKDRQEKEALTEIERLTGLSREQIPALTEARIDGKVQEPKVVVPPEPMQRDHEPIKEAEQVKERRKDIIKYISDKNKGEAVSAFLTKVETMNEELSAFEMQSDTFGANATIVTREEPFSAASVRTV